jgi:hypothetical protein
LVSRRDTTGIGVDATADDAIIGAVGSSRAATRDGTSAARVRINTM